MSDTVSVQASIEAWKGIVGQRPTKGYGLSLKRGERWNNTPFSKLGKKRGKPRNSARSRGRRHQQAKVNFRPVVKVTAEEWVILKKILRQQKVPQRLGKRIKIILSATEVGITIKSITQQLGVS